MGGGSYNIGIGHGVLVCAAGNKTCNVGHIHHKYCANLVGDVGKQLKIDSTGISGCACDQQLGLMLLSQVADLIIVDKTGFVVDIIGNDIIVLTGNIGRAAVGQVTTIGQAHTHHRIAGLQQSQLHSHIGLGTGVRLDIGCFRAEQSLGALDTKAFQLIHKLAAAIVTLSGKTLGILIGQYGAHCRDHSGRGKVLRCDQLQTVLLTLQLTIHHCAHFGVKICYKTDGIYCLSVHNTFPLSDK